MEIKLNAHAMAKDQDKKWYFGMMGRSFTVIQAEQGCRVTAGKYSGRIIPDFCCEITHHGIPENVNFLRRKRRDKS